MANLLEYDIRVIGRRALDAEFASIERRLAAHNATVSRLTGMSGTRVTSTASVAGDARAAAALQRGSAREAASAAQAAARAEVAAKRQASRDAAAIAREERRHHEYWQRTALQKQVLNYREEQRAHRQALQEKRREERKVESERKRSEREAFVSARREARERVSFVQSTLGGTAGRVGRTISGIGATGLATVGISGAVLAAGAITQATKLDEGARRLAIQGRDVGAAGADPEEIRRKFVQVGIARGIAPEEVMRGAAAYSAETGDLGGAMANLDTFATVSQAAGASIEEIATAAAHLRKLGITSVDDVRQSLASLTMQGKKGSFEIKNMAAEFPEVTAQAANFGIRGVSGLRQVGGLMQVAKTASGSGAEASTAVQTMFRQLAARATDIQSGKSFEGRKVEVFQGGKTKGELRNFRDVLGDILVASRGDLPQLQDVFDVRGIKAVNPLITKFRETRTAALRAGATESDASTTARDAALSVLDNAANVPGAYGEVQRDASDAMRSWSVQLGVLEAQLKDVVATQLFPELVKAGPALKELVPALRTATRAFVATAKFFAENPLTGIGAIIAAQIAMDIGRASIGKLFASLVERMFGGVRTGGGGARVGGGTGGGPAGSASSSGTTVAGWGRSGRGAGGVFGRPGLAAAGMSVGAGLMIGAPIAASIYGNGIAEFEGSEDRISASGQDLNRVRGAGVAEIDMVRSQAEASRKRVSKLKRMSFWDEVGEGMFKTFGDGPTSREVELNTERNFQAEIEAKLAKLEVEAERGGPAARAQSNAAPALQELTTGSESAAKSLEVLQRQLDAANQRLARLATNDVNVNRTNSPSPIK